MKKMEKMKVKNISRSNPFELGATNKSFLGDVGRLPLPLESTFLQRSCFQLLDRRSPSSEVLLRRTKGAANFNRPCCEAVHDELSCTHAHEEYSSAVVRGRRRTVSGISGRKKIERKSGNDDLRKKLLECERQMKLL